MRHSFHRSAPVTTLVLMLAVHTVFATEDSPDLSQLTLERIFQEEEFEVETFGPARWLEDGSGHTTLEASEEAEEAKEIVRYDPATGKPPSYPPRARNRSRSTTTCGRRMADGF